MNAEIMAVPRVRAAAAIDRAVHSVMEELLTADITPVHVSVYLPTDGVADLKFQVWTRAEFEKAAKTFSAEVVVPEKDSEGSKNPTAGRRDWFGVHVGIYIGRDRYDEVVSS